MKIARLNLFAGLFSAGPRAAVREAPHTPATPHASAAPSEVLVTASSQPYVLQGKMLERNMTHGETVIASLSPVRLEAVAGGTVIYFCPMRKLDITETLTQGDGGEVPASVVIEDFTLSEAFPSGLYTLKNVRLTSNGAIQIKATATTELEVIK